MIDEADLTWLFASDALKIAPADAPFCYTSGLIGPYYINTHYLCGGPEHAEELLGFITNKCPKSSSFPAAIRERLLKAEREFSIFQKVIEALLQLTKQFIPIEQISHVSGGERRDWFFSPLLAEKLDKPHLYIYNNKQVFSEEGQAVTDLQGATVLHVADLLTVGSSYTDKWIPALTAVGAELKWSINGVDRCQGGEESLLAAGVSSCHSLFSISQSLFSRAFQSGLIDKAQLSQVLAYLEDPFSSMREFLIANPQFTQRMLGQGGKAAERCRKMLREDLYNLPK